MRPLPEYERLHRQLEKSLPYKHGKEQFDQLQSAAPTTQNDPEIDVLVALACHVQQTHAGFARRLEARILFHHATLHQQEVAKKQGSRFFSPAFRMSVVGIAALVCFLLGASLLALAAPITNPSNPLYTIKKWEQHVQLSLAHPPLNQAGAGQQIAPHPLNTPTITPRNRMSQNTGNSSENRFGNNDAWQNGNEPSGKAGNSTNHDGSSQPRQGGYGSTNPSPAAVPTMTAPHNQSRGLTKSP